ncbi:unannotated protein [freshwater metagenome]|uniref:Unannotated protein n=1 Tax=freshwater metagenome TaxID=449393 RepID=A0A6J6K4D2_9ZZZZ
MLAIELSTSIDCALEILGTASIAKAVTPCLASASRSSGFSAGLRTPTKIAPFFNLLISASAGAVTERTRSAPQAALVSAILAPAAS